MFKKIFVDQLSLVSPTNKILTKTELKNTANRRLDFGFVQAITLNRFVEIAILRFNLRLVARVAYGFDRGIQLFRFRPETIKYSSHFV